MSHQAYTLLGLTAIVGGLVGLVVFAFLRFSVAARDAKRRMRESGTETALLSAALEEAIGRLRAQERAMAARAEASERLSGQIVASLTAGLAYAYQVVSQDGSGAQVAADNHMRSFLIRNVLSKTALALAIVADAGFGNPLAVQHLIPDFLINLEATFSPSFPVGPPAERPVLKIV